MNEVNTNWKPELLLLNALVEKLDKICTLHETLASPKDIANACKDARELISGIERGES